MTPGQAGDAGLPSLAPYVPDALELLADRTWIAVDGTMVSADISGFTALTEQLAALGREGAEQLTGIFNERFTEMIDAAHRCGGDVVKFGGDAILVLFTGDRHARRAVVASKAMRAAVDTPVVSPLAGKVQLRMSIGMHSGSHTLFVTDPGHRELMITGPGPTACVRAESAAEANQILVTAETAAMIDPAWIQGPVGEHFEISGRAVTETAEDRAAPRATPGPERATDALSLAVRQRVLAGTRHGEHRLVTVAFLRFAGTDHLVTDDGPHVLAAALGDLADKIEASCRRYGVHWLSSDVNPDGGKIILTAGAPVSTGNDETAVLRAVRDIIDSQPGIDLHIGVNRGPVFVTDLGAPSRRCLTIMGDPVNLAARLTGQGGPNEIIASAAVLERCNAEFEQAPLEPFLVKGKTEPIHAARVGALVGAGSRLRFQDGDAQVDVPLVGRDDELGRLLAARTIAEQGDGQVIELVGPAGSGKTRLIRELAVRSGTMRIFTLAADPYLRSEPLALVRPLVRQIIGVSDDADPDFVGRTVEEFAQAACPDVLPLLPLAAPFLDTVFEPTAASTQVHESYRRARGIDVVVRLTEAALSEPAMFLVEDVHDADQASVEMLRGLTKNLSGRPWLWCLTRHDGTEGLHDDSIVLELDPLDAGSARALIENVASAPMTPNQLDHLVRTSDGNPLFALELATLGVDGDLPETLEALLAAQLDRLDPTDRLLLSDLSVLGVTADHRLVDEVVFEGRTRSADENTWTRLRSFLDPQQGTGVAFRHIMVRRAAYGALAFARRRELHSLTADILAERKEAPASVVAQHYAHAERHAETFDFATLAADRSRAAWATEEAIAMYDLALDAARRMDGVEPLELERIAEALGDAAEIGGRYDEADAAYRRARQLSGGLLPIEVRLLCKVGDVQERLGKYTNAIRWYQRAVREIEKRAGDAAALLRITATLGIAGVRHRQGRFVQAIEWAEKAERDAIVAQDDDSRARAAYIQVAGHSYLRSNDVTQHRIRVVRMLTAIDDLLVRAKAMNNLGIAAYYTGAWTEAVAHWEDAAETFDQAGSPTDRAYVDNNLGEVLSDRGDTDAAEALFRRSRTTLLAVGYPSAAGFVLCNLGRAVLRAGRTAEGIETLRSAVAELSRLGADSLVFEARARLAEALLAEGSVSETQRVVDELLAQDAVAPALRPALLRIRATAGPIADRLSGLRSAVAAAEEADLPYERLVSNVALLAAHRATNVEADAAFAAEVDHTMAGFGITTLVWDPTVAAAGATP
ncbi:tetratricopeptide repeat protein [Actinospongicola halichondriae]|uniref:tetratricopeptide repeat protein n=1 Tax=Actinospongicola halichondriae TaxID=3236844 RepID=UPI003D4DB644